VQHVQHVVGLRGLRRHQRVEIGGDTVDGPPGTLVLVRDPALTRAARATQPGTTVLAVGGVPGSAYEPLEWERRGTAALS
jgi:hypothetical protein